MIFGALETFILERFLMAAQWGSARLAEVERQMKVGANEVVLGPTY